MVEGAGRAIEYANKILDLGGSFMEVIEKRRRLREQAINKEALSWAAGLPFKVTAMLVGSHARGDFNLWSDIDVVLISEDPEGGPIERLKALDIP